jgi:cytochrome P450
MIAQQLPAPPQRLLLDLVNAHLAQLDLTPQARRQHGDFYTLTIAGQPVVVLTHPDHAQHVLQRPHLYPKAFHRQLATANDEVRLEQLRLLRPEFHRRRLAALCDLMVQTIDEELQRWSTPDSPPLDLLVAMSQITLNVLARTMFGPDLPASAYERLAHALHELVEHSPGDESAQLLRATPALQAPLAVYDASFDQALALCRQAETNGQSQTSLLALLLDAFDARGGDSLTEEQLREEILFIFFVGFENIAAALAQSFHLLMAHPAALAQLQSEVDEVLAGDLPTLASVSRLVYAGMVLQETLRLHPPVAWLHRRALAADLIDGHPVPAGARVLLAAKLYASDPEFWANPTAFDPEHFRPEDAARRHACAWLPFGAGQRFCLGKDFALMEGKLILAMTLQRFDFTN